MKARTLLAALILFSLVLVPTVSAEQVIFNESFTDSSIGVADSSSTLDWFGYPPKSISAVYIQDGFWTNKVTLNQIMAQGPEEKLHINGPLSAGWPVTFTSGGVTIGHGEFYYFRFLVGGADYTQAVIDIIDIDLSKVVNHRFTLSPPPEGYSYPSVNSGGQNPDGSTSTPPESYITSNVPGYGVAMFNGVTTPSVGTTFHASFSYAWENRLTITDTMGPNNITNVQYDRNTGPNKAKLSSVYITDIDGLTYDSLASEEDLTYHIIGSKYPLNVTVDNHLGRTYTRIISLGDTSSTPAIIHIRSAQTGALIPGATVSILDGQTGTTINKTFSTGTGTITLKKASTLRYLASATAEGYTSLGSIQFGTMDDALTLVLWMTPDTPPDDPIEEGKSLLYGYALTQGSQQPISGATVALDGYGTTTTTSTGFYSFVNVTPGDYSITATATTHDTLSESVTVAAPSTQHNMVLTGQHTLTITAKDADTLANVQNATISLSDGQESTQNPITFTVDYGTYTITTAAEGYYPANQYQYIDSPGTTTATVLMTAKPPDPTPPELPNYPPHNVKFTVLTLLGIPIPDVNVSAQGFQQTPSQNILERLLGLNMTSTPINSELMSGTTDSNGDINFMMVEAIKYRITLYKPDVVNQTLEIYPKEDTYPIIISTAGGPLLPDAGDPLRSILVNVTTSTDNDVGHIHIDYNDTTHKTTGLSIQVTQQNATDSSAPEDVIASYTVANDANVSRTFDLDDYKGRSYFVRLEAEHPDFGTVHRDYGVAFKGVRVPLGPLPDGLYIYVAGFGLMLLGGIFTATSATRGVVVIALAGWLFYGFGWLDDLGLAGPAALGLVTVLAIFGVIVTRYREEGYQ